MQLVVASRGSRWEKHAGPENAAQYEPDGLILVDPMTHESVTEIDVRENEPVVTVAQEISMTVVDSEPEPEIKVRYDWESERSVEGRTYSRSDSLVPVDAPAESL